MRTSFTIFWLALIPFTSIFAAPEHRLPAWETDIGHALGRAKKEKKDVILVFRGPSANPNCKVINEKVFDGNEFRTVVGNQFVLFHVIDPKDRSLDEAEMIAYRALLKRFNISIYPITLLADGEGRVYGQTTIQETEAKFFVQAIAELGPRKALLEKALKTASVVPPDPKALSAALDALGIRFVIQHHLGLVDKVIALDQDDALGLKSLWEKRRFDATTLRKFNHIWVSISRQLSSKETTDERIALLDETIKKHVMKGELLQLMEMRKYVIWLDDKNYREAVEIARNALLVAPDTPLAKRLPMFIKHAETQLKISEAESQSPSEDEAKDETPSEEKVEKVEEGRGES